MGTIKPGKLRKNDITWIARYPFGVMSHDIGPLPVAFRGSIRHFQMAPLFSNNNFPLRLNWMIRYNPFDADWAMEALRLVGSAAIPSVSLLKELTDSAVRDLDFVKATRKRLIEEKDR
jgi:hypothetical protein